MRTTSTLFNFTNNSITQNAPSLTTLNEYFYLPALGAYDQTGKLWVVGTVGDYWSSSTDATFNKNAYEIGFASNIIMVDRVLKSYGYVAYPFE